MKKPLIILMVLMLITICQNANAFTCEMKQHKFNYSKEEISESSKTIYFTFFETHEKALRYAEKHNLKDKIFKEQTGGYYIIENAPNKVFVCTSILVK